MKKTDKWMFFIVLAIVLVVTGVAYFGINFKTIQVKGSKDIRFGIDIRGGVEAVYAPADLDRSPTPQELETVRAILETRLDNQSILDREVTVDKTNGEVLVRFPWKSGETDFNPQKAIAELGETALLSFRDEKGNILVEGKNVKKSTASVNTKTSEYVVALEFDAEGAKQFEDATSKLIGKQMGIYMDDTLISAPRVDEKISGGKAVISHIGSMEEAQALADKISAGALPFSLEAKNFSTISPTLGNGALKVMLYAASLTFILIWIFMIGYYRLPGFVACVGLVLQVAAQILLLTVPQITLTLPGIAGMILSLGMGVDTNIIIAERIKEEVREGKSVKSAIETGYKRAFSAVLDGNLTTVIVAVILMIFGSGAMLSFGYTLLTGVLMNFISGITASKLMVTSLSKYKALRKPFLYGDRRVRS